MKHFFRNNILILGCFLALLFYLLLFPINAFQAACDGLDLWFHTLLPSLLPFCVLSNILITSGIVPKLLKPFQHFFRTIFGLSPYGVYTLFLGLLCGYPMGTNIIGDLYRQQKINSQEGNYLLTISNHASPMFITTYISLHIFENTISLPKTFFILYSSVFMTSLIFRFYFHFSSHLFLKKRAYLALQKDLSTKKLFYHIRKQPLSVTSIPDTSCHITIETVDTAIFNGFETITKLGGYIILFAIFSNMLLQIFESFPTLQWFLPCITELTTGIKLLTQTTLSVDMKYILVLTFTSFGGISTIAQTKGMLYSTPFHISTYIFGKIINALCTFMIALLFFVF